MTLSSSPYFFTQSAIGITDKSERKGALRILPEDVMSPFMAGVIKLSIVDNAVTELPPVIRRLWADTENRYLVFRKSFKLIDKGRYLCPTPGSPLAAIEEDDSGWSLR